MNEKSSYGILQFINTYQQLPIYQQLPRTLYKFIYESYEWDIQNKNISEQVHSNKTVIKYTNTCVKLLTYIWLLTHFFSNNQIILYLFIIKVYIVWFEAKCSGIHTSSTRSFWRNLAHFSTSFLGPRSCTMSLFWDWSGNVMMTWGGQKPHTSLSFLIFHIYFFLCLLIL